MPGTVSSNVEELAIVEHQAHPDYFEENNIGDDGDRFHVTLTIENNGDKEAVLLNYEYYLTPYDADGNDISDDSRGTGSAGGTELILSAVTN